MTAKTAPEPKTLRLLSRSEVLAAPDLKFEDVETPEWGGPGDGVRVWMLTGALRDKYQAGFYTFAPTDKGGMRVTRVNNENQMARLVALSVGDAEGNRIFTDADVIALGDKSAIALERVNNVAMRLSGLQAAVAEALKEGLKETQNGTHGSD